MGSQVQPKCSFEAGSCRFRTGLVTSALEQLTTGRGAKPCKATPHRHQSPHIAKPTLQQGRGSGPCPLQLARLPVPKFCITMLTCVYHGPKSRLSKLLLEITNGARLHAILTGDRLAQVYPTECMDVERLLSASFSSSAIRLRRDWHRWSCFARGDF